jgi:queuosine precursor transporter
MGKGRAGSSQAHRRTHTALHEGTRYPHLPGGDCGDCHEKASEGEWIDGLGGVATIFAANWAIAAFGVVPVGFGLMAPAGVYFAGLAFTFRDLTQEKLGRRAVVVSILLGAALSALVSPQFALASGAAFLFSELADFGVYTPLRKRFWLWAIIPSNLVGALLDSVIFLALAFGSLEFLLGQVVGKTWVTLLTVPFLLAFRRRLIGREAA